MISPQVGSHSLSIFSQSFAVLPTKFCHLHHPTSVLLPSCISSAILSIPIVPHLRHRARPPLYSPLTLPAISIIPHIHRASVVVLPCLCCGPHPIIFHRPVYFAAVVCLISRIGYSPWSELFCTTLIAPHYFSHSLLWSSHYVIFFSFDTTLLSLRDVFDTLPYVAFFSTCIHSALLQSNHSPQLCLFLSNCSISDLLNSDCSAHTMICLRRYALITLLISTMSFVLLYLLISLKITHYYVTHHPLLACTIT